MKTRLLTAAEHPDAVIGAVRRAQRSVWIATANLKEMRVPGTGRGRRWDSVLSVLDDRARAGVHLRVLHAALPSQPFRDAFDRFPRLVEGGLRLRMCPRVHMKAVVVDARFLYLGSANWTGAGLGAKSPDRRNFELGIVTDDDAMIDGVQAEYSRIWRGEACRTCRQREVCPDPLDAA